MLLPVVAPNQLLQSPPPSWLPDWLDWLLSIGRWVRDHVLQTLADNFTVQNLTDALVFLVLLLLFYFLGKFVSFVLRRTLLDRHRLDPVAGRLAGHFIVFFFLILGFSAGLTLYGTSIAQFATALGLLTLALGFGMQNTVANLVAGISLAADRPIRIGDRIKVGDYWGTVQAIGLRSTTIVTPRKETVIIPNKVMDEREIWNYTLPSPEYRLDIEVGISLDSAWQLAEKILLEISQEHPNILHYPTPRVLMRGFADSTIKLELRAWIADVTLRADTISDILKATKDRFDREGVEIPTPYRTLVYKKELKTPAVPRGELKPFSRVVEGMQEKILIAVSGPQPARERAIFVASLAKALSAGVVGLYIKSGAPLRVGGEDALRQIGDTLKDQRIWFKPVVRYGAIIRVIRDVAKEEDVQLVVVGAGRGPVTNLLKREPEVGSALRAEMKRPVFVVPKDLRLSPQVVGWLRDQMKLYRDVREGKAAETEADGAPAPSPPPPPSPPPSEPTPPSFEPLPPDAPAAPEGDGKDGND